MIFIPLLAIMILSGSFYTHTKETSNTPSEEQTQTIAKNSTNDSEYAKYVKISVLLKLHAMNKKKALQYACALALQLQRSDNPVDQELYQILCQYIALAFQETAANQNDKDCEVYDDYDKQNYEAGDTPVATPVA